MLSTRVWALWRGYYIILSIYFLILAANIINYVFLYGIGLTKGTVILKQPPYIGCSVNPLLNTTWDGISIVLRFETLSVGLIFYKSWLGRHQDSPLLSALQGRSRPLSLIH